MPPQFFRNLLTTIVGRNTADVCFQCFSYLFSLARYCFSTPLVSPSYAYQASGKKEDKRIVMVGARSRRRRVNQVTYLLYTCGYSVCVVLAHAYISRLSLALAFRFFIFSFFFRARVLSSDGFAASTPTHRRANVDSCPARRYYVLLPPQTGNGRHGYRQLKLCAILQAPPASPSPAHTHTRQRLSLPPPCPRQMVEAEWIPGLAVVADEHCVESVWVGSRLHHRRHAEKNKINSAYFQRAVHTHAAGSPCI
jgi:hypothetical protein